MSDITKRDVDRLAEGADFVESFAKEVGKLADRLPFGEKARGEARAAVEELEKAGRQVGRLKARIESDVDVSLWKWSAF